MEIFKESYCYFFLLAKLLSFLSLRSATRSSRHGLLLTKELKLTIGAWSDICCWIFLVCASIWGGNWYDGLILYAVSFFVDSLVPVPTEIGAIIAPYLIPVFVSLMFMGLFNVAPLWSAIIAIGILLFVALIFYCALKRLYGKQ